MYNIFMYVLQCEYVCLCVQIRASSYFYYMDDDNSNKI
jgi:hypothetical protein